MERTLLLVSTSPLHGFDGDCLYVLGRSVWFEVYMYGTSVLNLPRVL